MHCRALARAVTFAAVLLAAASAAAQQLPRVGWLGSASPPPAPSPQIAGFLAGMRDLGYVEGRNVVIEYRWAMGRLDRLPALARELGAARVDVIVASGIQGLSAGKQAGGNIPVVALTCDPLGILVESMARPGGSATGATCISAELAGKRLEIMKELMPQLSRLAVLYNAGDPNKPAEMKDLVPVAARMGIALEPFEVRAREDFEAAFKAITARQMQAVMVLSDALANVNIGHLAALALSHRLPAIYGFREFPDAGGLAAYGANIGTMFRRVASHVDKVLKGAKPGDIPVEQPTTFELVINLATARALGIEIPPAVLARAEVIE